jgi:hypothetical protein
MGSILPKQIIKQNKDIKDINVVIWKKDMELTILQMDLFIKVNGKMIFKMDKDVSIKKEILKRMYKLKVLFSIKVMFFK